MRPRQRSLTRVLVRVTALSCIACFGLSACTEETSPDPTVPEDPVTDEAPGQGISTIETDPTACSDPNYPVALSVGTDIPDEVPLLRDVAACTDASQSAVWLGNNGEVVWKAVTSLGGNAVHYSDPAAAEIFVLAAGHDGALLLPGHGLVVEATPAEVQWLYDGLLSAGWGTFDLLWDTIEEEAPGSAARLFQPSTARGKAVRTCVVATLEAVQSLESQIDEGTAAPSDAVGSALGTAAGASLCTDAWRAADQVSTPARLTADDLARLPSVRSQQLAALDEGATRAIRANRILGIVFRVL